MTAPLGDNARHSPVLVLTAHGSVDPRAAANTHQVADRIRRTRPGLEVQVAFCERSAPNLGDVLAARHSGVHIVTPLLLADAYHARIDIPAVIAAAGGSGIEQAEPLGEDDALLSILRERLAALGVSPLDEDLGVIVAAVGSSRAQANARTATVADRLTAGTRWAGAATAFVTGPQPTLEMAAHQLRRHGARRLVIAPWFLAGGLLTDRVAEYARAGGTQVAQTLGAHRAVVATALSRFDHAAARAQRLAA